MRNHSRHPLEQSHPKHLTLTSAGQHQAFPTPLQSCYPVLQGRHISVLCCMHSFGMDPAKKIPVEKHSPVHHTIISSPSLTPDLARGHECETPEVRHSPRQPLLHHLTGSGELIFSTTAGQVPHKHCTKRNKLTFVHRPLYLYSFREWNERQMFHCNIFMLSTTEKISQDKIRFFLLVITKASNLL